MKGSLLGLGSIAIILILGVSVIIYATLQKPYEDYVSTREGELASFGNFDNFFLKTFNQSVEFISQRTAYDIAKSGGFNIGEEVFWDASGPNIPDLEKNLERAIESNLPSYYKKLNRTVRLLGVNISISPQTPSASKYFIVTGDANLSVYDDTIRALTIIHQKINTNVSSSYFKLLYIARQILEDPAYNSQLNDLNNLRNSLITDFPGFDFEITPITKSPVDEAFHEMGDVNWNGIINMYDIGIVAKAYNSVPGDPNWNPDADLDNSSKVDDADVNIVRGNFGKIFAGIDTFYMSITDECYPGNTYCLAPLSSDETRTLTDTATGDKIPYDYISLKVKLKAEQTASTQPENCSEINPATNACDGLGDGDCSDCGCTPAGHGGGVCNGFVPCLTKSKDDCNRCTNCQWV